MSRPTKQPLKAIGLREAIDLMGRPDHRLMKMATADSPSGCAYYVVPGGYVLPDTAKKIIAHPNIVPSEDGLFPGASQTWRFISQVTPTAGNDAATGSPAVGLHHPTGIER